MHRIGIISDTHGLLRPEVAEVLRGCETILHGGDLSSPEILRALRGIAPTFAVRGNNDGAWASSLPETLTVAVHGIRFFLVHNRKDILPDAEGAEVIVYGHSHRYEEKYVDGRLWLNPGSCGPRRFTQPITFAVMEIGEDGSYLVEKKEIAHQPKKGGAHKADRSLSGNGMGERDGKKLVAAVMRDTDKKIPVAKIAVKNGISEELAEQICRLYLTHPGVNAEGILGKMGL